MMFYGSHYHLRAGLLSPDDSASPFRVRWRSISSAARMYLTPTAARRILVVSVLSTHSAKGEALCNVWCLVYWVPLSVSPRSAHPEWLLDWSDTAMSAKKTLSPIFLTEEQAPYANGSEVIRRKRGKKIVFGWYGGKFSHLDWLLPLLPPCHHYCEPFAGSAAVLLNREPSPVETYNDIDGEIVHFFRVLRERTDDLIKAIALTPFSREEFYFAVNGGSEDLDDVERARRFFVRARQARTGLAQTATLGRWANCKNTSRAGMSGVVSRWLGSVEGLPEIAMRLLRVQIENRPAIDVIRLYDDPGTLFYCDPPYPHESRGDNKAYGFEMSEAEHRKLAEVLNQCKGKVAISGYRCELFDELYGHWRRYDSHPKQCHSIKKLRQECVWMNY
jgi:DNA adenine methylase